MATYNGESYLQAQIDSILCQLGTNDEIIISDDGSTDRTISILESYHDPRIKLFKHKPFVVHSGYSKVHYTITANFANALGHAKGNYIFLSDQDDIWYANKIQYTLPLLDEYGITMSNFSTINQVGDLIEEHHMKLDYDNMSFWRKWKRMRCYGCCMAFTREILKNVYPFPKKVLEHDNWIALMSEMQGNKVKYINEPLIYHRIHEDNYSNTSNPLWYKVGYRLRMLFQLFHYKLVK